MSRIRPLTPDETTDYIRHRLDCAGHRGDALFTPGALEAISKGSQGAPRNINNICHQALCAGAMTGNRTVDLEIVQNVIARLEGREIEVAPRPAETPVDAPAAESAIAPAEDLPASPAEASTESGIFLFRGGSRCCVSGRAARAIQRADAELWNRGDRVRSGGASGQSLPVLSYSRRVPTPFPLFGDLRSRSTRALPRTRWRLPIRAQYRVRNLLLGRHITRFRSGSSGQRLRPGDYRRAQSRPDDRRTSCLYAGHYDAQLDEQIYALNPDLKDPENLEAGQLIRLPLPPGTLKRCWTRRTRPSRGHSKQR